MEGVRSNREHLYELDSLRGLAALVVVFRHFINVFPLHMLPKGHLWHILGFTPAYLLIAAHEAVVLFFVLSGFVLALPFLEPQSDPLYIPFIAKRICRIYVPYLVAIVLSLAGDASLHGQIPSLSDWFNQTWSAPITFQVIFDHVLFVGTYDYAQLNTAIWSLVHEMRASLIFPILVMPAVKGKIGRALMIALSCSFLGGVLFAAKIGGKNGLTVHYISFFMLGALLARERTRAIERYHSFNNAQRAGVALACVSLLTYGHLFVRVMHRGGAFLSDWGTGVGSALLIVCAMAAAPLRAVLLSHAARAVGKMSYSLYLLHGTILFSVIHLLYGRMSLVMLFCVYLSLTLAASTVFYRLVESPAIARGKHVSAQLSRMVFGCTQRA